MTPQLAIAMGDPAGVGPEIIVKACKQLEGRIRAGELQAIDYAVKLAAARQIRN